MRVVEGDPIGIKLEHREIYERWRATPCAEALDQSAMIEHLYTPRL